MLLVVMSLTPANQIPQQSGSAEALHSLGVNAYQSGNLEEAIIHFRQALDLNPNYAEVHNDLGAALLAELHNRERVEDLSNQLGDFADTAAAIAQLDLVITVDTAVAHLAGALNHPVWVLLPFSPEWRWMLGREDSPWYPSMRLFRQDNPSDWTGVFAQIAEALRALAEERRHNTNPMKFIRKLR